ncbi:hypothetical protein ACLB2K_063785 [Fragaria x ananassa]
MGSSGQSSNYDLSFKILLIGDSAVGKSSLLVSFISKSVDDLAPTIEVWDKEVELYSTNQDCVKVLVGNKVDRESERAVSREEGIALAKDIGCMFLECSAKTRENVEHCFQELALKIMEIPSLLEEGSTVAKRNILKQKQENQAPPSCCS